MSEETAVTEAEPESPSVEATDEAPESPSDAPSDEAEVKAEGSTPADKAEADAEPEEWANLLKKFNGNKESAGKAYWKVVNDNAAIAKENKELKAYREAAEKAKSEKPAEPHPTLKEVDQYITALTNDYEKNLPTQEANLFKEYRGLEKDVVKLEYQLETADNVDDKRSINAELRAAKTDLRLKEREIRDLQKQANDTKEEINKAKKFRANFEKQQDEERANKEREAERQAKFNEDFPTEINGYVTHHAKALGFPTDDKDSMEELTDSVYEYLMGYAARFREEKPEDVDWNALVEAKIKREAAKSDKYGRAHFQKVSKEAKPKTPTKVEKPSAPAKSAKDDDELTPGMRAARERLNSIGF